MIDPADHLTRVGEIVTELCRLGLDPVLVGGMALVVIGSRRVTRDFDFLVAQPAERLAAALDVLYDRGLHLVSTLDERGDVTATIGNRRVAATRLRIDAPASAYFYDAETDLRIDLLFDFPLPATGVAARARRMKIGGRPFALASEEDLLELKQIAKAARSFAGDAQDIEFLESRLGRS